MHKKWTLEKIKEEAKKYKTKTQFARESGGAYEAGRKKYKEHWKDITSHMEELRAEWSLEYVKARASNYSHITDFRENDVNAYEKARKEGWLNEATEDMSKTRRARKWTLEKIKEEATKYKTKGEFARASPGAYEAGRKKYKEHWAEITSHMEALWEEKWCYESVKAEAAKYKRINDFQKGCASAYDKARKKGWFDSVTEHMDKSLITKWTFEAVKEEAQTFNSRGQFAIESGSAYAAARARGWLEEVCSHMTIDYNGYFHCRYIIINERLNKAYIGVTSQPFEIRMMQHKKFNNATKSASITNLKDTKFVQESEYKFTPEDVRDFAEQQLIDEYIAKGYEVLNHKRAVGSVGYAIRKWTVEMCQEEALKYETRWEFQKRSPCARQAAFTHGWMDQICAHMKSQKRGPLTEELALEITKNFGSTKEIRKEEPYVYKWLCANNLMDKAHEIWGTQIKEKQCIICGKKFTPIKNHFQKYCSNACSCKARYQKLRAQKSSEAKEKEGETN